MSVSGGATRKRVRAFEAFAQAAQDARGEYIHDIILYGSVARNEATEQSDVDVLVVLNRDEPPEELSKRPNKLSDLAFDVGLEYNVNISVHICSKKRFESYQDRPFLQNVLREGRSFQRGQLYG
jgi:predicted nucleotidyltransferase